MLIGETRLRVRSLIAEGGFAVVFAAQDQSGRQYALKQQIANDKDALNALSNEIQVMEEVGTHLNRKRTKNAATRPPKHRGLLQHVKKSRLQRRNRVYDADGAVLGRIRDRSAQNWPAEPDAGLTNLLCGL